jgi:glycosyltransferase involved in cell wall biosynthesis
LATDLDIKKDVCMVGLGTSAPCYYRVMLPAMELGCDWTGVAGYPPRFHWLTGSVRGESQLPDLIDNYKIVVLQQPHGESWEKMIETMQEHGKKVVFEVDDYLHGIQKRGDHQFAEHYDDRALLLFEMCMRKCDAMIVSTQYLFDKYKKFNPNIYLCRNGIDLNRYKLTRPKRNTVNIGWAGATGHAQAMLPWLHQVQAVMNEKPETCFISIGLPFAKSIAPYVGEDRCISIPWTSIETYPSAMSMFDIALAPSGGGGWYRGKSDLRWLEASALGIATIARPSTYPEIEHGVTGFHATSPQDMVVALMELIGDKGLREEVGRAAKAFVTDHRSMPIMAQSWQAALEAIHAQ